MDFLQDKKVIITYHDESKDLGVVSSVCAIGISLEGYNFIPWSAIKNVKLF